MEIDISAVTSDKNNEAEGLIELYEIQEGDLVFRHQEMSMHKLIILSGDKELLNKNKIDMSRIKLEGITTMFCNNLLKLSRYSSININYYRLLESIPKDYKMDLGLRINITRKENEQTERINKVTFTEMCNFITYQDSIDKDYYMSMGDPIGSCIIRNDKPMQFEEIY